jgi:CheY-like chemotaxis protein
MNHQILIVEDDNAMAQLLVESLGRRGYQAKSAGNAETALTLLQQHDFEAVITDINMKGLDGLSLCERIVARQPGLPVLVITAFGSTLDTEVFDAGATNRRVDHENRHFLAGEQAFRQLHAPPSEFGFFAFLRFPNR